jgi:general secretion pathway protein D
MIDGPMKREKWSACWILSICMLMTGCATERALRDAQATFDQGKFEESLAGLHQARETNPTDPQLRLAYLTMRDKAIAQILGAADDAKRKNDRGAAKAAYQRVLALDRDNGRAKTGLQELERDERHNEIVEKAKESTKKNDAAGAAEQLRTVLTENLAHGEAHSLQHEWEKKAAQPATETRLTKALQKTLSIDFKDAMLKQVFEVFARTTSVNFVFDKDVRTDQKVTVFLNRTSVREALDVVLFTNQLEQRALDTNTILVYPNTPAKLKDYQQLTVRGFFLAHAEPDQVANALKSLLKMKDVVTDKRQSMITVRDTAEAVRLAQKLVALLDLPEPEVMLEVEILEINRNRLTELGIKYPSQLTLTPLTAVSGDTLTLSELRNVNSNTLGASISPIVVNAKRQTADINLLANPRIRARNRETAKILIGDKVPNITTTSTATGFVASNVQYLDVGLKLEVVPTITVDSEIAIKISLEVSNIASQITTTEGTIAYQIGTRSASTVLRLKDGENQVLAGLINDDDRRSANKIPGLGDIPLIGRLFSSNLQEGKKTEIVLSITPRLVRNNLRPDLAVIEFESGTENSMRGAANAGLGAQNYLPAPGAPAATAPSVGKSLTLPPPPPAPGNATANTAEPAAATPAIRWEVPAQVKAGETFTVALSMNTSQPITGVPLAIGFEPGKFDIVNVQEGNLLAQNGGTTSFSQRVERASGQIFITGTRNAKNGDNSGAVGDGALTTLTVKATGAPGPAAFRLITIAPLGLNGASVPASVPAPVTITIVP